MNQQNELVQQLSLLIAKLTQQAAQLGDQARGITDLASMKRVISNWLSPMVVSLVEAMNAFTPLLGIVYAAAENATRTAEEARIYADINELRDVISFLVPAVTLLHQLDLPEEPRSVVAHMARLVSYLSDTYPLNDDMVTHLLTPPASESSDEDMQATPGDLIRNDPAE